MSSTYQGNGIRDERDFYATPKPAFDPILAVLPRQFAYYDPCEGDGRLVDWMRAGQLMADGNDLFPQTGKPAIDFLQDNTERDFIVTNPPFSIGQEFADHAIAVANHVLLLFPLNFLGSEERKDWWQAHEPDALFVLSKRPSFAMSCTCKSIVRVHGAQPVVCNHKWTLPISSKRPKTCPVCNGTTIRISTSDSCNYAWFYWGKYSKLWKGINHV